MSVVNQEFVEINPKYNQKEFKKNDRTRSRSIEDSYKFKFYEDKKHKRK